MLSNISAPEYWAERAKKLQERAVGYGDQSIEKQNDHYTQHLDFVFEHLDKTIPTLDYGCGTGRYASMFEGQYIGMDMTKDLLKIAMKGNPGKTFVALKNPYFSGETNISWIEQVFFATVLQHCDDLLVMKVLCQLYKYLKKDTNITLSIYENSMNFQKPHVTGRAPETYYNMVLEAGFSVEKWDFWEHVVKGENHALSVLETKM